MMNIKQIEQYIEMARRLGVTEFSHEGLVFKLGMLPSTSKGSVTEIPSQVCKCSHALYDHTANGCIHCGPSALCLTPKKGK